MIKVSNRKVIFKLSLKCFRANKIRNIIAVLAIALTTVLFTSLFTIAISMNYSWQQQTMRMTGSYAHGSFKYLTEEQAERLKKHPLITEYGASLVLSMLTEAPFNKQHTEIRYAQDNAARIFFSYPTTGRMPQAKNELAVDTDVLDLLGVPHKIGQLIKLTYPLGQKTITDTFELCGFWEKDKAIHASLIWLSKEYAVEKLADYVPVDTGYKGIGRWGLDVMFANSYNIEQNICTVAEDNGYNSENPAASNYIDTGVNWAYTSTHMNRDNMFAVILGIAVILLLIIFTGYLIIYNIFQISVAGDIRFYGLLKTIGTTSKQMKRIIRNQAMILSLIAIPFGLTIGFVVGNLLGSVIMRNAGVTGTYMTFNPWIFFGATLFSLFTVVISCRKPGKMAAVVSPIEAILYSESRTNKVKCKKTKKSRNGAKVYQMAVANLMRNKKKTFLVIISLSLSIILLNFTYTFSNSFDMEKFLNKFVVTDFIIGQADYFQGHFSSESQKVSDSLISAIEGQEGLERSGRVYGKTFLSDGHIKASHFQQIHSGWPQEWLKDAVKNVDTNGNIVTSFGLYGLEDLPMDQLKVIEGTLDKEKMKMGHYLAQVIFADDYGKPQMEDAAYDIGDKVNIHYCTDYDRDEKGVVTEKNSYEVEYEVLATVMMPDNMSYRRFGAIQFAMSADTFIKDTGTANTMIYMGNTDDRHTSGLEAFIKNYTEKVEPDMHYESKASYIKEFNSLRLMFLLVGGVLSLVIGLVGILNFINSELTCIMTRRREFAMLQSIGMTVRQLRKMLAYEGMFHAASSIVIALVVSIMLNPLVLRPVEKILWFFTYQFTIIPILILLPVLVLLGIAIPLVAHRMTNKHSIVEQLRES